MGLGARGSGARGCAEQRARLSRGEHCVPPRPPLPPVLLLGAERFRLHPKLLCKKSACGVGIRRTQCTRSGQGAGGTLWTCSVLAACLQLLASRVLSLLGRIPLGGTRLLPRRHNRRQPRLPRRLLLLSAQRPGCTVPCTCCARLRLGLVPPTGCEACLHFARHRRLRLRRLQRPHKPFDGRRHRPLPQRALRRAVQLLLSLAPRRQQPRLYIYMHVHRRVCMCMCMCMCSAHLPASPTHRPVRLPYPTLAPLQLLYSSSSLPQLLCPPYSSPAHLPPHLSRLGSQRVRHKAGAVQRRLFGRRGACDADVSVGSGLALDASVERTPPSIRTHRHLQEVGRFRAPRQLIYPFSSPTAYCLQVKSQVDYLEGGA